MLKKTLECFSQTVVMIEIKLSHVLSSLYAFLLLHPNSIFSHFEGNEPLKTFIFVHVAKHHISDKVGTDPNSQILWGMGPTKFYSSVLLMSTTIGVPHTTFGWFFFNEAHKSKGS